MNLPRFYRTKIISTYEPATFLSNKIISNKRPDQCVHTTLQWRIPYALLRFFFEWTLTRVWRISDAKTLSVCLFVCFSICLCVFVALRIIFFVLPCRKWSWLKNCKTHLQAKTLFILSHKFSSKGYFHCLVVYLNKNFFVFNWLEIQWKFFNVITDDLITLLVGADWQSLKSSSKT
jgi:hypothetical protein